MATRRTYGREGSRDGDAMDVFAATAMAAAKNIWATPPAMAKGSQDATALRLGTEVTRDWTRRSSETWAAAKDVWATPPLISKGGRDAFVPRRGTEGICDGAPPEVGPLRRRVERLGDAFCCCEPKAGCSRSAHGNKGQP